MDCIILDPEFMKSLFFEDEGDSECDYVEKLRNYFTGDIYGFGDSELSGFTLLFEFVGSRSDGRSKSTRCISGIGDNLAQLDRFLGWDAGIQ